MKSLDFTSSTFQYNDQPFTPTEWCSTLVVAHRKRVYPFLYNEKERYLQDWKKDQCQSIAKLSQESLALHWWNKMIKLNGEDHRLSYNSIIIKVMQKHCPAFMTPELGPRFMNIYY